MTKKDLMNGMIVELRDGTRYLYCEGVMRGLNAWDLISNYTDNLKIPEFPRLDIVKVYEDTKEYNLTTIFEYEYLALIWQRSKPPKLSEKEIEILKALAVLGFKYIARDRNNIIYAYYSKPLKALEIWFYPGPVHLDEIRSNKIRSIILKTDLFSFITWVDEEPVSIKKLLEQIKELENDK